MDLYFGLSVVVMLVGLVLMPVATGKAQDVGRLMFHVGLTVSLLRVGGHAALHIGA